MATMRQNVLRAITAELLAKMFANVDNYQIYNSGEMILIISLEHLKFLNLKYSENLMFNSLLFSTYVM